MLLEVGIIGLLASRGLEMGSDHHHDQEDSVHASAGHDAAADESDEHHGDEHHGDEHHGDEHDETAHMIGASVGVAGGVLLVLGHLMNIRATKRRREDEGRATEQNSACSLTRARPAHHLCVHGLGLTQPRQTIWALAS
jgi:hypothetical protein